MQGWFGDVYYPRPTGIFEVIEKAKWDAWNMKKGMPRIDAQRQFAELVEYLGMEMPDWWTPEHRIYNGYQK